MAGHGGISPCKPPGSFDKRELRDLISLQISLSKFYELWKVNSNLMCIIVCTNYNNHKGKITNFVSKNVTQSLCLSLYHALTNFDIRNKRRWDLGTGLMSFFCYRLSIFATEKKPRCQYDAELHLFNYL